jgi:hypothetical protein
MNSRTSDPGEDLHSPGSCGPRRSPRYQGLRRGAWPPFPQRPGGPTSPPRRRTTRAARSESGLLHATFSVAFNAASSSRARSRAPRRSRCWRVFAAVRHSALHRNGGLPIRGDSNGLRHSEHVLTQTSWAMWHLLPGVSVNLQTRTKPFSSNSYVCEARPFCSSFGLFPGNSLVTVLRAASSLPHYS